MSCDPWLEAISARADGEAGPIDARLVEAHLATCASCRAFAANVHDLRRAAAIEVIETMPDLSGVVVKAARLADRGSVWWVLRLGLGVVAVQVLVLSVPALFLGHAAGSDEHAARHQGSFAIAYAIGLLVVSLRPAKARGMLPLAAALAGCLAITAIIDISEGRTPMVAELHHLPELVGLLLVWVLARPARLPAPAVRRGLPRLRAVDNGEAGIEQRRSS
jgi:predicted anti-sigma-YlaC factor YlaD